MCNEDHFLIYIVRIILFISVNAFLSPKMKVSCYVLHFHVTFSSKTSYNSSTLLEILEKYCPKLLSGS